MTKNTYWNEDETTSERIGPAQEAFEYEKEACGAQRIGEESAEAMATLALMKATLALVEQQRIANILKLDEISLRAQSYDPPLNVRAALGLE